MKHSTTLTFVAAVTILGLAGFALHANQSRQIEALGAALRGMEAKHIEPPTTEIDASRLEDLESEIGRLQMEVAGLHADASRRAISSITESAARPDARETREKSGDEAKPALDEMQVRSELEQLLGRLAEGGWDYSDPTGELARFIELSRSSDELDAAIADLEAAVNAAPDDIQARLTLAEYYVGKLMTVAGPEQGLWGSKAESQWTQVLERDDKVWRAHHALGTNYSYYPSVMGKSDAAIEHLQSACELQRDLDPHPQHVQTYLFLSRMHSRNRNIEAARSTLEEGLDRHPGDAQLIAELDRLEH